MSNTPTLQKRGRKTGSADSVLISLETLLQYVKPNAVIPVRRKWAEELEKFNNVKFIDESSPVLVSASAAPAAVALGDEKDSVIRPRVEFAEEALD